VVPYHTEYQAAWYDAHQSSANFVVLAPVTAAGYPGFTNKPAVVATFGPPAHVYRTGKYEILVWNKNLLAELG
jgi:hypothetical protein